MLRAFPTELDSFMCSSITPWPWTTNPWRVWFSILRLIANIAPSKVFARFFSLTQHLSNVRKNSPLYINKTDKNVAYSKWTRNIFISSIGKFHSGFDFLETGKTPSVALVYLFMTTLASWSLILLTFIVKSKLKNYSSLTVDRSSEKLLLYS